jgi:hypothetical protein
MDELHLQLLGEMALWARQHGERVSLDSSVLLALLDEIYALRLEKEHRRSTAAETTAMRVEAEYTRDNPVEGEGGDDDG